MIHELEKNIESLSKSVHESWEAEKVEQGFHSPNDCQSDNHTSFMKANYRHQQRLEDNKNPKFYKWCDKCHIDMYPYEELPENIKEYDRVTVRTVVNAIKGMDITKNPRMTWRELKVIEENNDYELARRG